MTRAQRSITRLSRRRIAIFAAIAALSTTAAAAEPLAEKIVLRDKPKPLQAVQFVDGEGKSRGLSDFHGKFVLLNIWATWCVPCRKEMPALDRLEATLGGRDFQVVPLSIDRGGAEVVRKFFAEIGIKKLGMYLDVSGDATRKLSVVAEWDEPANIAFVKCIIVRGDAPQAQKNPEQDTTTSCGGRVVRFPAGSTTEK